MTCRHRTPLERRCLRCDDDHLIFVLFDGEIEAPLPPEESTDPVPTWPARLAVAQVPPGRVVRP